MTVAPIEDIEIIEALDFEETTPCDLGKHEHPAHLKVDRYRSCCDTTCVNFACYMHYQTAMTTTVQAKCLHCRTPYPYVRDTFVSVTAL